MAMWTLRGAGALRALGRGRRFLSLGKICARESKAFLGSSRARQGLRARGIPPMKKVYVFTKKKAFRKISVIQERQSGGELSTHTVRGAPHTKVALGTPQSGLCRWRSPPTEGFGGVRDGDSAAKGIGAGDGFRITIISGSQNKAAPSGAAISGSHGGVASRGPTRLCGFHWGKWSAPHFFLGKNKNRGNRFSTASGPFIGLRIGFRPAGGRDRAQIGQQQNAMADAMDAPKSSPDGPYQPRLNWGRARGFLKARRLISILAPPRLDKVVKELGGNGRGRFPFNPAISWSLADDGGWPVGKGRPSKPASTGGESSGRIPNCANFSFPLNNGCLSTT